ncbi:hypothetical protein PAST3_03127 [Cutibacterium acnes HL201PA1]|nr:hypothetical protein PAST3_03127 [Cutibacterium acnes HL201PA1]
MGRELGGVILNMQGYLLELVLVGSGMVRAEKELATVAQRDAHIGLCAATITTVRSGEGLVFDHRGAHDNLLRLKHRITY